jgi:hypothetical protein
MRLPQQTFGSEIFRKALPITTARKKTITVANLVIDELEVRDIAAREKNGLYRCERKSKLYIREP